MARVTNAKDILARNAIAYITTQLNLGVSDFREELDKLNKLDATYISERDGSAKVHIDNAIRMLRWIYETEFGLSPPTPFTDGDVDGVSEDIRTSEDFS